MRDRSQPRRHLCQPPRRQHEGIAAGQDHLPDFGMRGDVGKRGFQIGGAEHLILARPHHLAAEAEAAIDRANMRELQEHAVGVAMHDARNRTVPFVADGIGALIALRVEFGGGGHELLRDRVVGIARVDEIGNRRRDGDGIARRDGRERIDCARARSDPPPPILAAFSMSVSCRAWVLSISPEPQDIVLVCGSHHTKLFCKIRWGVGAGPWRMDGR